MCPTRLIALLCMTAASLGAAPVRQIVTVAHRGGIVPGYAENTLKTYRHAIACGVDAIEVDLRGTKDRAIVILHDPTVDRTTDGHGPVADLTLPQVKALDAGGGEHVPEFSEVLDCVDGSGVLLILDIKEGDRLDAAQVVRLVAGHHALLRVIVGARTLDDVRRFKRLDANLRVLGFVAEPRQADAFIRAGADIIRLWPDWIRSDQARIAAIHAQGRAVWTTAGEASDLELRALAALGVDGILSDYPERLRNAVNPVEETPQR